MYIQRLSRVALKHFPKIEGRVRDIDYLFPELDADKKPTGKTYAVARVWWDDGSYTKIPLDKLILLTFYQQDRYPWEKPEEKEKPSPDDVKPKDPNKFRVKVDKKMDRTNIAQRKGDAKQKPTKSNAESKSSHA